MKQMTQATGGLGTLRRRVLAAVGGGTVLAAWIVTALVAGGALALDAIVVLPAGWRVAAWGVLAAGVVVTAVVAAVVAARWTPLRLAGRVEAMNPVLGSALTNAVQLERTEQATPVGRALAAEAVRYGRERAAGVRAWPLVRRGVLGLGVCAAVLAVVWALAPVVAGDLLAAVVPRFTDPYGDHPPYSRVRIELTRGEGRVLYGGQHEVHAAVSGAPADSLELLARPLGSEAEPTRVVMFRRPDGSYFQTLTGLSEPTEFWVTDGRARTKRQRVDIIYTPQIELVRVARTFPAYTGLSPAEGDLKEEALRLPLDTRIAFEVTSNRPLQKGTLELTPLMGGEPLAIPLVPDEADPRVVRGAFAVEQAAAFSIGVTDTGGIASTEPVGGRVLVEPDRRPRLQVLEPGRAAVATPDQAIPVHVRAEDDYGVEQVVWFRGFNRSVERPSPMAREGQAGAFRRVDSRGAFNLAELGVRPGDVVQYFFEAIDNNPRGPSVTTSRIYTLQVISHEQYEAVLRQMRAQESLFDAYSAIDRHLSRLADRAASLRDRAAEARAPGATPAPEQQRELSREWQAFQAALDEYERALAEAAAAASEFDVEKSFQASLADQQAMLRDLRGLMNGASSGGASSRLPAEADLRAIADRLAAMSGRMTEEVGEPARQIAAVARLTAMANRFVVLTGQQSELAELAKRFRDRAGEFSRVEQMQLQELANAQRRIADDTDRLLADIADERNRLPADPTYDDFKRQIDGFLLAADESALRDDLAQAAEHLTILDGGRGHDLAYAAWEKMDALIARCEGIGGSGQACLSFQPTLSSSLGNTLDQIMAAMRGQTGSGPASGYSLFNEQMGLYGPDFEMPRDGAASGGSDGAGAGTGGEPIADASGDDALLPETDTRGRIRLQPDARFPLRYRDLVGDYFRAVAEAQDQDPDTEDQP